MPSSILIRSVALVALSLGATRCAENSAATSTPDAADVLTQRDASDASDATDASDASDASDAPLDEDRDGTPADRDCDDRDPSVHPGATEICDDRRDNDCNGAVDLADRACRVTHCGPITVDTRWERDRLHVVTCDVRVEGAASPTLTIADGARGVLPRRRALHRGG